jgi:hypothetical protein
MVVQRIMQHSPLSNFHCSQKKHCILMVARGWRERNWEWLQSVVYFLLLHICLFCTFHMNGVMHHVTFCVWFLSLSLFSRFIYAIRCISTSFLIQLHGYTMFYWSISNGHLSCSQCWLQCYEHSCPSSYVDVFPNLLGMYSGMELLSHIKPCAGLGT